MVTDTISDMLTRVRNANMVKHRLVEIPTTKMTKAIASILKEEGFIETFEVDEQTIKSNIVLFLKYKGKLREPVISNIEREVNQA